MVNQNQTRKESLKTVAKLDNNVLACMYSTLRHLKMLNHRNDLVIGLSQNPSKLPNKYRAFFFFPPFLNKKKKYTEQKLRLALSIPP